MEYSQLGTTDISIAKICFGCWAIGGHGYGVVDDSDSVAAIHKALDLGINFFDTADVYGFGHSEKILGRALDNNKDVIVATKFGVAWDSNGRTKKDCSPKHLRRSVENSLRRLNREYIDIYQIHYHDGVTPIDDLMVSLLSLKDQGKIRYIGCSNMPRRLIDKASMVSRIECAQFLYCLNDSTLESDMRYLSKKYRMTNLAYGVLGRGLFSGKYSLQSTFLRWDTRREDPNFTYNREKNLLLLDDIKEIGVRYNKTPSQIAVRWVLENSAVSCALLGMKKMSQVIDNVGAVGWVLDEQDRNALTEKALTLFG